MQKRNEKRIARTGPSLPETLRLLAPLASTLDHLNLSGNKLGGMVTPDIIAFTKLTALGLNSMGLEGASLARYTAQKRIEKPIANLLLYTFEPSSKPSSPNSKLRQRLARAQERCPPRCAI